MLSGRLVWSMPDSSVTEGTLRSGWNTICEISKLKRHKQHVALGQSLIQTTETVNYYLEVVSESSLNQGTFILYTLGSRSVWLQYNTQLIYLSGASYLPLSVDSKINSQGDTKVYLW